MSDECDSVSEPLRLVLALLGKRWTGMILGTLLPGPANFSDLRRAIPGISDRILHERLLELGSFDLVSRNVIEGPPLRVQYALTNHGEAMRPIFDELSHWAIDHLAPLSAAAVNR